jgi:hypothetical protein
MKKEDLHQMLLDAQDQLKQLDDKKLALEVIHINNPRKVLAFVD